jgi:hypothetical protein
MVAKLAAESLPSLNIMCHAAAASTMLSAAAAVLKIFGQVLHAAASIGPAATGVL